MNVKKYGKAAAITIFILSLAPYALALFGGIHALINGTDTGIFGGGGHLTGFEAFTFDLTFMLAILTFFIPVIPPCLIYQVSFICSWKMRKKNIPRKERIKTIALLIFLMLLFLGMLGLCMFGRL